MVRKLASTLLTLLLAAMLLPCPSSSRAGDDLFLPPVDMRYAMIKPVDPGKADEIKIQIPRVMETPRVIALPDLGALVLGQRVTYGPKREKVSSRIMAVRYGRDGKKLWSRIYEDVPDGYVFDALALPGGGFVFACGALSPDTTQRLVFCDEAGAVLNTHSYGQIGIYQYLFAGNAGEVYAVGTGYFKDGKLVDGAETEGAESDVSILKFNGTGNMLLCRKFGGSAYENPTGACWSSGAGLVLSLNVGAADGDIEAPRGSPLPAHRQTGMLAAFGGDGAVKWQYWDADRDNLSYFRVLAAGGGVLAEGSRGGRSFILLLDANGRKMWETAPDGSGEYAVLCTAGLADGRFAAVVHRYAEDDGLRGVYLVLCGEDGGAAGKIRLPDGEIPLSIAPAGDGGLLTIGMQNVKALPAPAFVSAIWYDTETIATRYDGELNIVWRKIYNRYRNSTRPDVAVPSGDGALIVEGS